MTCPHCGADVPPGSSHCYACRQRLGHAPGSAQVEAAVLARPGAVVAIAVLDFLGAAAALLIGALLLVGAVSDADARLGLALAALLALLAGGLQLACGLGLLWLKPWARTLQVVVACLSICNVLSILVLIYLLRPGVKVLFSGRPTHQLSELELRLVARQASLEGSGPVVAAVVLALALLVLPALLGILAAIAIPSLLRAKITANESGCIGDLRRLLSAQAAYSSVNGGAYEGRPHCLASPDTCLPGYSGPVFLEERLAAERVEKNNYVVRFFPGPAIQADPARQSPSSVRGFVVIAEPREPGKTAVRSFCGDQSGVICSSSVPHALEGQDGSGCPVGPACEPLL